MFLTSIALAAIFTIRLFDTFVCCVPKLISLIYEYTKYAFNPIGKKNCCLQGLLLPMHSLIMFSLTQPVLLNTMGSKPPVPPFLSRRFESVMGPRCVQTQADLENRSLSGNVDKLTLNAI